MPSAVALQRWIPSRKLVSQMTNQWAICSTLAAVTARTTSNGMFTVSSGMNSRWAP
jgi:hypothetical protein